MTGVIIIGGGPAGMSCALWLKHFGLKPVIIDRQEQLGGALLSSAHSNKWVLGIENNNGIEIAHQFEKHIRREGIPAHLDRTVETISQSGNRFTLGLRTSNNEKENLHAAVMALCMGLAYTGREAFADTPGFAGVEKFGGITFGQPSIEQIQALQGTKVAVIGGGDNAHEAALHLAANGCEITLIMRAAKARAQPGLQKSVAEAEQAGQLRILRKTSLARLDCKNDTIRLILTNGQSIEAMHVFALLGYVPRTALIKQQLPKLNLDKDRFIKTDKWLRTSIPHIYAAGDIITPHHPCVVSALSSGALAARTIERDLRK